ncbi:MAG: hypothetical protein RL687_480 [Candidatus Parcubacteria bacterium]|jgi:hypothetical protein
MIKKITSFLTIVALFVVSSGLMNPLVANAASITSFTDTVTDLTASTAANHTIVFTTPTGVASGQTIILTFNNSTSIAAALDYTDMDVKDDGVNVTLAATPSGATWGAVRTSGTVITLTNGTTAVAGGSVITILIGTHATNQSTGVRQITNGSAGTTILSISGTFTDTGSLAIPIISNGVVAVAATVQPTISFTLSDNTIYFGNLASSGACFAQGTDPGAGACASSEAEAFNMTASTNSPGGYSLFVQGATLTSGGNTIDDPDTNTASTVGSEQFGLRLNVSGAGSGTVSAPYAAAGYAYAATSSVSDEIAAATAASLTNTYSVRYIANISPVTEAGSYTTNHTYVATGNF